MKKRTTYTVLPLLALSTSLCGVTNASPTEIHGDVGVQLNNGDDNKASVSATIKLQNELNKNTTINLGVSGGKKDKESVKYKDPLRLDQASVSSHDNTLKIELGRIKQPFGISKDFFDNNFDGIKIKYTSDKDYLALGYGSFKHATGIDNSMYTYKIKKVTLKKPTLSELFGLTTYTSKQGEISVPSGSLNPIEYDPTLMANFKARFDNVSKNNPNLSKEAIADLKLKEVQNLVGILKELDKSMNKKPISDGVAYMNNFNMTPEEQDSYSMWDRFKVSDTNGINTSQKINYSTPKLNIKMDDTFKQNLSNVIETRRESRIEEYLHDYEDELEKKYRDKYIKENGWDGDNLTDDQEFQLYMMLQQNEEKIEEEADKKRDEYTNKVKDEVNNVLDKPSFSLVNQYPFGLNTLTSKYHTNLTEAGSELNPKYNDLDYMLDKDHIKQYISDTIDKFQQKLNNNHPMTFLDEHGNPITKEQAITNAYIDFVGNTVPYVEKDQLQGGKNSGLGYLINNMAESYGALYSVDTAKKDTLELDSLPPSVAIVSYTLHQDNVDPIDKALFLTYNKNFFNKFNLNLWGLRSYGKTSSDFAGQKLDVAKFLGAGIMYHLDYNNTVLAEFGKNYSRYGRYINGGRDDFGLYNGGGKHPKFYIVKFSNGNLDYHKVGSYNAYVDYKYFDHGAYFGSTGTDLPDKYLDGIKSYTLGLSVVPAENWTTKFSYTFNAKSTKNSSTLEGNKNFKLSNYFHLETKYHF